MADLFETLGLGKKPDVENAVSYALYPDQQPAGAFAKNAGSTRSTSDERQRG